MRFFRLIFEFTSNLQGTLRIELHRTSNYLQTIIFFKIAQYFSAENMLTHLHNHLDHRAVYVRRCGVLLLLSIHMPLTGREWRGECLRTCVSSRGYTRNFPAGEVTNRFVDDYFFRKAPGNAKTL